MNMVQGRNRKKREVEGAAEERSRYTGEKKRKSKDDKKRLNH